MRVRWLIFTVYLLLSLTSPAQTIDELRTDRQVLAFLNKLYSEMGPFYIGLPKQTKWDKDLVSSAIQFGRPTFEKADLDRNGHTDLLFNGYGLLDMQMSIVVLGFGDDSFLVKQIPNKFRGIFAAHILFIDSVPYVNTLAAHYERDQQRDTFYLIEKRDTLMYILDDFIEKASPGNYTIEQIKYRGNPGLSMFFPFSITINEDSIIYSRPNFGILDNITDSGGTFIARIDLATKSRIIGLLQHINFPNLKADYLPVATCNPFGLLLITYNNGKTKKVSDTGLFGTYGLRVLHSILWDLGSTQQWTLLKPMEHEFSFIFMKMACNIYAINERMTLQGLPAATTSAGMSFVTTLPAPITDR